MNKHISKSKQRYKDAVTSNNIEELEMILSGIKLTIDVLRTFEDLGAWDVFYRYAVRLAPEDKKIPMFWYHDSYVTDYAYTHGWTFTSSADWYAHDNRVNNINQIVKTFFPYYPFGRVMRGYLT